jgi:predicted nucleotidyltransferase
MIISYFTFNKFRKRNMVTRKSIERAIAICREYGVTEIILFGSAASNLRKAHDLDLAIDGQTKGDILDLAVQLEEELSIQVDVVKLFKDDRFSNHIRKTGKVIYA